jgi:glycosyltransferase involved in cell wall biosynthesis
VTTRAVYVFTPSLSSRDAVGHHCLATVEVLAEMGFYAELLADEIKPEMAGLARPYQDFQPRGDVPATLIYEASTASPMAGFLAFRPEPLVVDYHNVTPAALVAPYDPFLASELAYARHQISRLAGRARGALANSNFSANDLAGWGFARRAVAPVLAPGRTWPADGPQAAPGREWLFVGRVVANKAQADLVVALAMYRQLYDPKARLTLVGQATQEPYGRAVRELARSLGIEAAVSWSGPVDEDELARCYRRASVFVCLSDHEGFGVPLLEAMDAGLPVVAYSAGATGEVVGEAGICLRSKSPAEVAAAVHLLASNRELSAALVRAGRARAAKLSGAQARSSRAAALSEALAW